MWLINTETLRLHYFHEAPFADYAVLSHTWIDGQEVTMEEWLTGRGRDKFGYQKIVNTCRQARQDGLRWAWVDTCCINKESSVELSEAINSMWIWYRNAQICYAYLEDVDGACLELLDFDDRIGGTKSWTSWHGTFWRSRWCTRGWTLQELIALRALAFFGQDWNFIGTKSSLLTIVHRRAAVDKGALQDCDSIGKYAIARRMSWAAHRETTRVEERAYSLLGIFGVNMPLLYGEGERAFQRLQEEIIRYSLDHSIFAWAAEYAEARAPNYDTIFAASPDAFASCNKMERVVRAEGQKPFRLDNRGLFFEALPVSRIVGDGSRYLAILDCMYENDPRGRLALSVIAQHKEEMGDDRVYSLDPDVTHRRLEVCDEYGDNLNLNTIQRLTLLRHQPPARMRTLGLTKEHLVRPRIRLCLPRVTTGIVQFLDAFPHSSWDETTMVCSLPRPDTDEVCEMDISVQLRDRVTDVTFSLALTVPSSINSDDDHGLKMAVAMLGMPETRQKLSTAGPRSVILEHLESLQLVPVKVRVARAYPIAGDPSSGVEEIDISVGHPLPQVTVSCPENAEPAPTSTTPDAITRSVKHAQSPPFTMHIDLFNLWL